MGIKKGLQSRLTLKTSSKEGSHLPDFVIVSPKNLRQRV